MLVLLERVIVDRLSYEFHGLANSLQVPETLAAHSFDLVLTDLRLPGLDGFGVMRFLAENRREEGVIMITGFPSEEVAQKALELGALAFLPKPLRAEQLVFSLQRALETLIERREARTVRGFYRLEPYEQAEARFRREYVRRLAARTGGDREEISRRCRLDQETIDKDLPKG
jgi:DNA-binding NtrC family response regulator